jgi:fused signal recognition particle receptor
MQVDFAQNPRLARSGVFGARKGRNQAAVALFRKTPAEQAEDDARIRASLAKTRQGLFSRIGSLFQSSEVTDETWDELEALLIQADLGVNTAMQVVERVRDRVQRENIKKVEGVREALKEELTRLLAEPAADNIDEPRMLTVVLIVGVNGSGKTTSIAKLAQYYKRRGRRVVLAAADTFRAAAIDQLKIWGERVGVEVIAQAPGADPGAVVFDAIRASQETRQADLLIIDTAGRLHTKYNLMKELEKVRTVAARQVHAAPHETLLVLDATTGQNAISQAKHFKDAVKVTGLILTKLDSTAKGGIVFAIEEELGLPVRFVGTGEKPNDFAEFDPKSFVNGILE